MDLQCEGSGCGLVYIAYAFVWMIDGVLERDPAALACLGAVSLALALYLGRFYVRYRRDIRRIEAGLPER